MCPTYLLKPLVFVSAMLVLQGSVGAQDGALDLTYNPTDLGRGLGDGANFYVHCQAIRANGDILIGGSFDRYNEINRTAIARLYENGIVNQFFDTGTGANGPVYAVLSLPDGTSLIAGSFTNFNGTARNDMAMLNSNGTLNTAFDPGTGANSDIRCMVRQADGKILIGGDFATFNGIARNRVARLNADGSVDASFDPGTGASTRVTSIIVQTDGKIIIGGWFTSYNGTTCNSITRLHSDGTRDTGFNVGTGANNFVNCVALQPDGKVLIGGQFTSYNGAIANRFARLNSDGTLDEGFATGSGANTEVVCVELQTNGKIMIGGSFLTFNGIARPRVARLNADGSLDSGFTPTTGPDGSVTAIATQLNGKVVLVGYFFFCNGITSNRVACLNADGSTDPTFNRPYSLNYSGYLDDCTVFDMVALPDGKVLIGGEFTSYFGIKRNCIARLNGDGTLDNGFDPGAGADRPVYTILPLPDGKIMIGGAFNSFGGYTMPSIVRLNANGTVDTSFDPDGTSNLSVLAMVQQPDGKIIIGGTFIPAFGGVGNRIARLNANGSLDASFITGTGFNSTVSDLILQADGKVVAVGGFTGYNGSPCGRIARLNVDGSLDTGFASGIGTNDGIAVVVPQPDGKMLIGGSFSSYNGIPRGRIARLNASGTLDMSFDPGSGFGPESTFVGSIDLLPDGRILTVGRFSTYNGTTRVNMARIHANGALDASFYPGIGNQGMVTAIIQPDGKVLIGGSFLEYNGTGRNRLARLHGPARMNIRLMLEGPYDGGLMSDALRTLPSFPLTEPFTAQGYSRPVYAPGAAIHSTLLNTTGNNAIVDWVIVEMRPAATPNVVAASRAVLLQRDGDIVDLDGVSTVGFSGLAPGNYCVAVIPRNHLPVMLSPSTPVAYGGAGATVDFTLPGTQLYNANATKNVGGTMLVKAGDVTFDSELRYVGANNDRDPILLRVGGSTPTATVSGYYPEDVNMDGTVKYTGNLNDRDPILLNIGGSTPTATVLAPLP